MDDLVQMLDQSLSASWLIIAVLLFRFPLKKAPKWMMGVLWAFVALRLLLPFSWESICSLVPQAQYSVAEQMASDLRDFSQTAASALSGGSMSYGNGGAALNWGVLWFLGFCAMLLYMLISYFRIHRKVREAVPEKGVVWLCDGITTPFILGYFKARIYLPSSISEEDRKYVLAHEQAHLERRDHQWKILGFLILAIYWFHPLVWLAYVFFCKDLELACDEKVIRQLGIESKKSYCRALINCSAPRKTLSACPLAFGETGVKERVKSVLHYRQPRFWVVLGAAAVCVVTAVCLLTDPFRITPHRILEEDGYIITDQRSCVVTLSIPKDQIPEDAYTQEGHTFGKNEVIAYQDETTTIYLESIQLANEGPDFLYLNFNTSYKLPEAGSILSTVYKNSDGTYQSDPNIRARSLSDDGDTYENAVSIRSEGSAGMFTFYAETDVFKKAEGTVRFDHYCNQITYQKDS